MWCSLIQTARFEMEDTGLFDTGSAARFSSEDVRRGSRVDMWVICLLVFITFIGTTTLCVSAHHVYMRILGVERRQVAGDADAHIRLKVVWCLNIVTAIGGLFLFTTTLVSALQVCSCE